MTASRKISINGRRFAVNEGYHPEFWRDASLGLWEPWTFDVIERYLSPSDSYIDVGAWIGPTLLYAACIAKYAYGLEPDPTAFGELTGNVALNPELSEKISIRWAAAGNQDGTIELGNRFNKRGGDSRSSPIVDNAVVTWEVPQVRMNSLFVENDISDCKFIKIDIEGWESVVVPDMGDVIAKFRPVMLLALHPGFFRSPFSDMKRIVRALSCYNRFQVCDGSEIDVESLLSRERMQMWYEVLALP